MMKSGHCATNMIDTIRRIRVGIGRASESGGVTGGVVDASKGGQADQIAETQLYRCSDHDEIR